MPHPLKKKMASLRRRARRTEAVHGLSLAAAALLGVIAAMGSLDYLVRFQDLGLRILASLAVLGVLGWTFHRFIRPVLRTRLRDVDLALQVQRHFPALKDRLLSAVEFLHQAEDDPTAGSPALRRAVIAQATAQSQPIDFADVLDRRPAAWAAALLAAACLIAGFLVASDLTNTQIAVARLANPFGDIAWPRTTHLKVSRQQDRVARGQAFQIEVVDADGELPSEVRIHYRIQGPNGNVAEETQPMQFVDGAMTARRENVQKPFSYRVEGGDDQSMPWFDVAVVDPPAIESISIRLIPPAYTGWPPARSERHIRALAGTRVQMTGKADKPLESAVLCLENGKKIPALLSDDGYIFTIGGGSAKGTEEVVGKTLPDTRN